MPKMSSDHILDILETIENDATIQYNYLIDAKTKDDPPWDTWDADNWDAIINGITLVRKFVEDNTT